MGRIEIARRNLDCDLIFGDNPDRRCAGCGAELPPRRRRWCSEACAHRFADEHSWSAARQAALERAGYLCSRCDRRTLDLQVHHIKLAPDYGVGCQHHQSNLQVLCAGCHRGEHSFRRDVDRVLVWADGVVSRQLVLPGVL